MIQFLCLILIVCSVFKSARTIAQCGDEFSSKCLCGEIEYQSRVQYVVNCTDTKFQNASVLQNLPSKTQVLIFTGNNIEELPMNLFGTNNSYPFLKVVDMSNNEIRDIRGKTYHRVSNVERLILNHNQISISSKEPNHHHPRVFSNFENLVELHLTDAFADNTPEDLASDLHDIFLNSELRELRKLHLEQNEIYQFKDPEVFCGLPNLQDLHLGQNQLGGLHFELDCLPHLRFLDLEYNNIKTLRKDDQEALDKYAKTHNQSFTIDLSYNTLTSNCSNLYSWLQATKVIVRNKNMLHCRETAAKVSCASVLGAAAVTSIPPSHTGLELCLFIALCVSLALLTYSNRRPIERHMKPLVNNLFHKVHYTNIGRQEEEQEISV